MQSYDGDDWGADEFEDDEPPPPPVPRVTTGLRPVGQRTESYGPSPMLAAAVASSSQSSSGPPSLNLQTQQNASPSTAAPRGFDQVHNAAAPGAGRTGSPAPASSGAGSSKAPSHHQPDVRSSTPQSTTSSGARASPAIRPSELYRHVDEDRRLGGSPLSIAEAIAAKPSDRATPPLNEPNRQNYNQGDGPAHEPIRKQATFDNILANREDSGSTQRSLDNAPVAESRPLNEETRHNEEEPVIHSAADIDRKRMSVSPQLPSMLRMSSFGDTFFSSSSGAPSVPQDPVKQEQPTAPAPVAPAPPSQSDKSSSHEIATIDKDPEDNTDSPRVAAISQNPPLAPASDPRAIPPLRTPSPHTKSLEVAALSGPQQSTLPEITPTEPLKPRVADYSPSDYEPQSAQTQQTMSTFNASPVKESDKLSEEIMKSLSPIGQSSALAPPPDSSQSLAPGNRNDTRNSSYTLSDYDNYWADTNEKPVQETSNEVKDQEKPQPVPALAAVPLPAPVPEQKALGSGSSSPAHPAAEDNPEQDSLGLRRKFSWEADFGPSPNLFKSGSPAEASSKNETPTINSPSPLVASAIQVPRDVTTEPAGPSRSSPGAVETPMIVVPPPGGISHQVSKASTLPPTQQPVTIEPPSPISVRTDESTPQALDRVGTGVEDKVLIPTPSTITASASPPPEKPQPQTLVLPPSEFPQTMPFRDIMNLSTPLQRTLKFDAGRSTYAAWESGLENWLSHMMTQQPEYAHATGSFSGAGLPSSSQGGHASTPSGSHSQQPYYQQYLNASSPTTTAPAAGRSRLGGLPLSTPSGSSSFGNSGNQLGTKSKEFMHSAGKMGKGLFSKGRSKLRGTGDKGEPIPPPVQIKTKNERRTSWGLSLGAKSRADEAASQAEKDMMYTRSPTQPHQAPQSSQSSVVSPFGPTPQHGDPGNRLASRESYGPPPMGRPATLASKDQEDRTEWQIPTPDNDNSTWDPFKGTDLGKDDASEHSGVLLGNREDHGQPSRGAEGPSGKPVSGGATPTLANTGIRMVPSEQPATLSQQPTSAFATPSQAVPAGAPPQTQNEAGMPQRQSSFVGLPLIRRGSTFDVTTKPAQPKPSETIKEGVSTHLDENTAAGQQGTLTSEVTVGSTLVGTDSLIAGKDFEKDVDETEQQTPADAPTVQPQQQQPQPPLLSHPQHPFQMHPVHQGPMPPQHPQFGSRPMIPHNMMGGNPIHRLPPSGPWKLEESHLSEPLHRVTPKPQQLPPSGQWKLEESHLAEPLHSVNRNRAGTSSSHQEPYFGYDKETGIDLPSPTSPVATSPVARPFQHRQKPSETPPSSANRYPGLFPGQQPPAQKTPKDGPPGPSPQFMRRMSNEGSIARTGTGGPEEERGRSRKASALFKDIGSRFRRGSSERRGTSVESKPHQHQPSQSQVPEHSHLPGDGASVSSITTDEIQERKKARTSFMLGLRNRPSTDHGRQKSGDGLMGPPPRPDEARPETSPEERKLSRFGTGLGALTGHHHRPSGPPRASTSNLANEPGTSTPLSKKRFSGFNTKATVSGVFHHRPSGDMTPKPGTPNSSRPVSSQLALQQQASLERPEFSHLGFERSNTAGPSLGQMQQPTPANAQPLDPQERRRRRGSAAGLISGLLGHGGKHKEEHQGVVRPSSGQQLSMQQPQQPQMQQPPMQQPHARQSSGPQVSNPQVGSPQLPRLQTQGQPQGPPQGRRPSGPQLPTPQPPGPQLGSPQLPGSHPASPQVPGAQVHSPQLSSPTIASPQPQKPQQFGSQQPPMLRRMTGTSSLLEQTPTSPDRPPSSGPRQKQQAQIAYQNSRPSPHGFGSSTTPGGTPPIGTTNVPSRHGTPQTPFSVGQVLSDNGSGRMRSTSPAASAVRPAPMAQGASHNSTKSLDKMVWPGQAGGQVQQPVTGSPTMAFRPDPRPANARVENNTRDDLPLSPVSQVSNMGPPSVSSIATGQSPRLTTSGPAMGRRQSSQLSQPNTPALSMASHTPPTQNHPFSTRMGMSPQQQHQQQFPSGFQQQAFNPQQGGQQNVPGQQQPGGFRGQPSPHPQSLASGRPSMQMQHSVGPKVPLQDMGLPPQPYATEAPRQGSPASSKWKGLKNRMSGQAVNKPSASQSKPEGEKLSASKILGAFKRSSKVPQQAPAAAQAYQGGQQQQQFPGQPPYGQTPTPRQSSQFRSPPVGQMQTPRQSSQFTSPPVGQMQTPRQSSQFTSPPMGQHQFQRPPGPIGQGQPGMGQPYPGYGFKAQGQFQSPPQPQGQFQSPPQPQVLEASLLHPLTSQASSLLRDKQWLGNLRTGHIQALASSKGI
ncbi:hypothetical protein N0V84_005037 [Fusarium piperis]|uniref:Uncharacterized protein n=1 Tax=Fusarium piperis TaxID=1435070 RepID=A0A9W8WEG7_9HYPO|nr:hypothetical protein N0V84_005037 [Fusarium piperis]